MPEEDEEEPRRKKKGKGFFSRKRILLIILILIIFSLGALFQHYLVEPVLSETFAEKYSRCLSQQQVLNGRFNECETQKGAYEYQLQQCKQA